MAHSYSLKSYPYDNAGIESFHTKIKRELITNIRHCVTSPFQWKIILIGLILLEYHQLVNSQQSNFLYLIYQARTMSWNI